MSDIIRCFSLLVILEEGHPILMPCHTWKGFTYSQSINRKRPFFLRAWDPENDNKCFFSILIRLSFILKIIYFEMTFKSLFSPQFLPFLGSINRLLQSSNWSTKERKKERKEERKAHNIFLPLTLESATKKLWRNIVLNEYPYREEDRRNKQ